ncbi:uncharacterized protein LOC143370311 [Andrena cerasifolii]|uniref:uncharacterized protein LOC143370311 n=1 Tax=Andrena cerasifolii TaxID=2819439 RepID=UPI004038306F
MFPECYIERLPDGDTSWLTLKAPLPNTDQNNSNTILTKDISKQVCEIAQTQAVENLSLSGNHLSCIPDDLTESLTTLVHLNLSNNELNDLPSSLNLLKNLVHLNLDCNQFTFIPNVISELGSLKALTARENEIREVPEELENLSNLEDLDLGSNCLKDLPDSCANLNCLKSLSLSKNMFLIIPNCIANGMHNLRVLNFSQNHHLDLNVPPKSVNLIAFFAENNNMCPSFPLWLLSSKYSNLETVSLNETRFKFFKLPDEPAKSCIKNLSMKDCTMFETTVEMITKGMTCLERLIVGNSRGISENKFWHLPIESLKEPSCLKEIDVSRTGIPIMLRTISNFVNLSKIDVSFNNINWLPDEICSLLNLNTLMVHKNKLGMLPNDIGEMKALRELKASYNNLYELPNSMGSLSNLQYIDLYDNEFELVPEVIEKLPNLIGLDLEVNYFSTDGLSPIRNVHYESMRDVLRDHWPEHKKILSCAKTKPPEEWEAIDKRLSRSSSSTEGSYSDQIQMCSYPEELLNQPASEHWDSSEDTADEFDPHECKEPKIRLYPPFTFYKPFQRVYCPADTHKQQTLTRVTQMLQDGTLVWPTNYEEGQFEDA